MGATQLIGIPPPKLWKKLARIDHEEIRSCGNMCIIGKCNEQIAVAPSAMFRSKAEACSSFSCRRIPPLVSPAMPAVVGSNAPPSAGPDNGGNPVPCTAPHIAGSSDERNHPQNNASHPASTADNRDGTAEINCLYRNPPCMNSCARGANTE